jgi:Ca2+-binding EF-hand superfamily protein
MLSSSTRYKVYQLLKAISENEEIVEEQRIQLAKQSNFEPWAAFKRIDRNGQGKISAYDINTFLQENMVDYIEESECFHMFNFFDKDSDGFLDFGE